MTKRMSIRKQYSAIIIGILFLVGCAGVQIEPTVNTSDGLRQIVVSDETTLEQDGIYMLELYASNGSIVHRVAIFVNGEEVFVRYICKADEHMLTCYTLDEQCDGKIDKWRVIVDGVSREVGLEEIQDYYDTHIIFLARVISKNGKVNKGEPVKWDG